MNILYISYDGIGDPLGKSQIIPYLIGLSEKGFKFNLLTFEKKLELNTNTQTSNKPMYWKRLRYHKYPPLISTLYDIFRGAITGISILATRKIEIIHARGYVSAAIALILKKIFGVKFIFDMRGLLAEEKVDAGKWSMNGQLYKITKFFERLFLIHSDEIIILTGILKKILDKYPYTKNKNINVIPTCVDVDKFVPARNDLAKQRLGLNARFIVLYFGSLGTFYAIDEMIDFFSTISKNYINNPFFLIVSNNSTASINEVMRLRNVPENNYELKNLPYEKIADILPIADVSLMFYKRRLSHAGCCPTKFAESLACGLPVVINSGIGDTGQIIKKERIGVVVESFSEDAYKKSAEQLIQLLSEENPLRRRCRSVAEKYFSLNDGIRKYLQSYQNLLGR